MNPGGSGTRADNITSDQASPEEGVDTLADDDSAMTPRDAPDDGGDEDGGGGGDRKDEAGEDGERPYRDEEE